MVSVLGGDGVAAALATEGFGAGGQGSSAAALAAGAAETIVAAATTGAAVTVDPVADFARATGVLNSPLVEAMTAEPAVTVFEAPGAGAPASGFFNGAGLKESRIFSAAA
jgi:hypothetical protein